MLAQPDPVKYEEDEGNGSPQEEAVGGRALQLAPVSSGQYGCVTRSTSQRSRYHRRKVRSPALLTTLDCGSAQACAG